MEKITIVSLLIITAFFKLSNAYLCQLRCQNFYVPSVCQYDDQIKCQSAVVRRSLTNAEKQEIVYLHNYFRARIARGEETQGNPGPQPSVRGRRMKQLVWDEEIAAVAQHWANQCQFKHNSCPRTYNDHCGENIALRADEEGAVRGMIYQWYDEVRYWNRADTYRPFQWNNPSAGHFTQMIWSETDRIGCGAVSYQKGYYNMLFLVCNYGPAGNVIGRRMYEPEY